MRGYLMAVDANAVSISEVRHRVDCFTLHRCSYKVVAMQGGAEICKHYSSHGACRDSSALKGIGRGGY